MLFGGNYNTIGTIGTIVTIDTIDTIVTIATMVIIFKKTIFLLFGLLFLLSLYAENTSKSKNYGTILFTMW